MKVSKEYKEWLRHFKYLSKQIHTTEVLIRHKDVEIKDWESWSDDGIMSETLKGVKEHHENYLIVCKEKLKRHLDKEPKKYRKHR